MFKIYPYKAGSRSARALADSLGCRILRREGSRYHPRPGHVIINWGSSDYPWNMADQREYRYLNHPTAVMRAANKLLAFEALREAGVSIPEFWTNMEDIPDEEAFPIVCRTVLTGHSGRGIVISNTRGDLVVAPLYTKYVKKTDEYRIHVVNSEVISIQRKARRLDVPDDEVNWRVRNHQNGFNFVRDGVNPPDQVLLQSQEAVASLGLDFGAVDVCFNRHYDMAYVLEVNCAPGITGTTVEDYRDAFRRHYG